MISLERFGLLDVNILPGAYSLSVSLSPDFLLGSIQLEFERSIALVLKAQIFGLIGFFFSFENALGPVYSSELDYVFL